MGHFRAAVYESWCSTIVREMSLICIRTRNSFPFEWLCTRPRFEAEECSNSEMGYLEEKIKLSSSADVLLKTSNLDISRCCFADDGK